MASIHKRTSDRTAEVSWQVKYRTPEGSARSRTFRLKRDADRSIRVSGAWSRCGSSVG